MGRRKRMKKKVLDLLRVGDTIFSANNGKPMKVTQMGEEEFYTEEDCYLYDEVTKLWFFTKIGYEQAKKAENNAQSDRRYLSYDK
jgi:hypothetical protein